MKALAPWAALLGVLLGLALLALLVPYQVDDAYITYRFAKLTLAGEALRFNQGGELVEGFSSPLWLALTTLVGALSGVEAIPTGSVVLGVSAYLMTALVLYRAAGLGALLVWVCLPNALFYAVTGLEACAFATCIAAFSAGVSGQMPRSVLLIAAALAPWIRPEAPWLAIAALVQAMPVPRDEWSALRSRVRESVAVLAVSWLVLLGVRYGLFHQLFPNTYYAKPRDGVHSLRYLVQALSQPWVWAILGCASVSLWHSEWRFRGYFWAGCSWLVACAIEGGDWMPQARMLLPACVLWALAAGAIGRLKAAQLGRALSVGIALVMALGSAAHLAQADRSRRSLDSLRREYRNLTTTMLESGARSVAAIDIGELGFGSELEIVDLAGLTDTRIAHAPGAHMNKEFDLGYVFDERKPDLIVVRLQDAEIKPDEGVIRLPAAKAMSLIESRLLRDARLREHYELALVQYPQARRNPMYIRALYRRRTFTPASKSPLAGPLVLQRTRPAH